MDINDECGSSQFCVRAKSQFRQPGKNKHEDLVVMHLLGIVFPCGNNVMGVFDLVGQLDFCLYSPVLVKSA